MNEIGIHGRVKRVKYRSYAGQAGKIVPNLLDRNFVAEGPYTKLATDVTQFSIASGKVYLSPLQDLFNGEIISYSITQRPVYSQIEEMLFKAFAVIPDDSAALLHSDQG